ncbi:MAG: alpha/beta hydrolase [Caulobacteraceae bacterium]|nr:alpha/beta hydrolase [Caulobacteraceae bacterium]
MTLDADLPSRAACSSEPRRRTFHIATPRGPAALAALDFGDAGRPVDVVFLHANGFNALTYRSALAPLADRLRILAVDQQGHGRSAQRVPAEGRTDWFDLRDDLIGLLDALDGPPVVLSGHSMGGAASVLAAAERPARVKALALFDPVIMSRQMAGELAHGDRPAIAENPLAAGARRRRPVFASRQAALDSYRGRGAFKTWPEAALADYVQDGFRDRPDGSVELACAPEWEASNFAAHGHDPWPAMARIDVPVTILRAEHGSTCQITSPEAFPLGNYRVRIETIAGTSHFLPIERPDLVRDTLLALS